MGLFSKARSKYWSRCRFGLFSQNYSSGISETKLERLLEHIDSEYPPSPDALDYESRQRREYCSKPRPSGTSEEWHVWMTKRIR